LGDVVLGTILTLVADRVGRRKVLVGGSILMLITGITFALSESFWILLFAAVIGVVSATGGDFGPFRSIEESIISQLTTPETRSDVLAWYVTISAWGSSVGSEAGGRIIDSLQHRDGWTIKDAYHAVFWIYAIMGVVNITLVLLLTKDCEADAFRETVYAPVVQHDRDPQDTSEESEARPGSPQSMSSTDAPRSWRTRWMGNISSQTLSVVWKLWLLLAFDSLADGMVPYSLTNYYMDTTFHPSKSTLGDVTSVAYFLTAIGGIFAGPLAKRLGLVKTMVFT
jgi:MFS family permease